jgi:hypothetical protein
MWRSLTIPLFCLAAFAAQHRIQLKPGRASTIVEARFPKSGMDQLYVLSARAGQHMRIDIRPVTSQLITAGQVQSPSGKYDGGPGGIIFDSDLTETGDYQVRVSERENKMPGKFLLEVELQ